MNVLFVGFGPHTRRIQFPYCVRNRKKLRIDEFVVLDTTIYKELTRKELKKYDLKVAQYFTGEYIDEDLLLSILKKHQIDHVILGTDPEHHLKYLEFFIKQKLNVLMDKPIVAVRNATVNARAAKSIHKNFKKLMHLYENTPEANVCILSQRRYHPGYNLVREDIVENYEKTGIVPHYIYLLHSDGQMRFLEELDEISYHGYNNGYGKISHSGYHFIDTLFVYLKYFLTKGEIDSYRVECHKLGAHDYSRQLNDATIQKIFKRKSAPYLATAQGEVDAYSSIQFFKQGHLVTSARIDMLHSGFTDRLNYISNKANLYKGNGRIRHEKQILLQGPIYAAYIDSLQSKQINLKSKKTALSAVGGEHHFDLIRFNHVSNGKDIIHQTNIMDIMDIKNRGFSRGHQEEARFSCLDDFLNCTKAGVRSDVSDLSAHYFSSLMMSKMYESLVSKKRVSGKFTR